MTGMMGVAEAAPGAVLLLRVGATWIGLPVEVIDEISSPRDVTSVPLSPDYVPGVMGFRRSVLPLLDLRTFLGLSSDGQEGEDQQAAFPRVVVVAAAGMQVGILCDQVRGLVTPDPAEACSTDLAQRGRLADFATTAFESAKKIVVVLDVVALLEAARLRER